MAFMDSFGTDVGGFVCPATGADTSRYLGVTKSGKQLYSLRYDLAAQDSGAESDRFAHNVIQMVKGQRDFR